MCSCSVTSTSLVQVDTWFTAEGQSSSSPGELGAHESTTAAPLHSFCKADTTRQVPSVALCSSLRFPIPHHPTSASLPRSIAMSWVSFPDRFLAVLIPNLLPNHQWGPGSLQLAPTSQLPRGWKEPGLMEALHKNLCFTLASKTATLGEAWGARRGDQTLQETFPWEKERCLPFPPSPGRPCRYLPHT